MTPQNGPMCSVYKVVVEGLAGWNISHLTRVIATTMLVGAEGKASNNLKIYVLRILSVKEKIKAYLS